MAAPASAVLLLLFAAGMVAGFRRPGLSIVGDEPLQQRSEAGIAAEFARWCSAHGKVYRENGEEQRRYEAFRSNLRLIDEHNGRGGSYWLGLNKFSDMTNEEFRSRYVGLNVSRGHAGFMPPPEADYPEAEVPYSIDWRKEGAVTEVKDQGSCGGCWAFSATGSVEGINKIKTGELISLSEQELIDCDRKGDSGCDGGLMQTAFQFIIENGGLDTEEDYSYRGSQGSCNSQKKNSPVVSIDSYTEVPVNDEIALLKAAAQQPVSVAIEGAGPAFQHYAGGVFTGGCGTKVNHGVLVVGYGSENGLDYWIVKNSWGPVWGEQGYMRMQRNTGNPMGLCSINTLPSYPIKIRPNPTPSPPPPPAPRCNLFFQCPPGSTCCCTSKLGPFCLGWGCCGMESAVCCPDRVHCCPARYPICDAGTRQCLQSSNNLRGVEFLEHELASLTWPSFQELAVDLSAVW